MKVLHVFKDYFPPTRGGIELHIRDLAHGVPGVHAEVLTSSRSRRRVDEMDGDVRVVRSAEYLRPTSTPVTPQWARAMRDTDADIVHFHMPNPFGEIAALASRTRKPIVVSYHADIVGRRGVLPFYLPVQQRLLRRAARIVVGSPPMLAAPRVARHSPRAVVLPYGVDGALWRDRPPEADALRARFAPRPLIGFLGRIVYYKGLDVLIKALAGLDATALIAGDGPLRPELERQAMQLRVADRVMFLDEVEDAQRRTVYHAIDVFVLPSTMRAEAFGISMLEAMAAGTPVISTELGTGTSWVNVDGETGLVVPPSDTDALARAVSTLLADDALRKRMGESAARRAVEVFPKSRMLAAFAELYRSV